MRPCNLLCDLLSTFLLLNLFWLAITKGLNTYWPETIQLFFFFNQFEERKHRKHNSILTRWVIVYRPVAKTSKLNHFTIQPVTQQNVGKKSSGLYTFWWHWLLVTLQVRLSVRLHITIKAHCSHKVLSCALMKGYQEIPLIGWRTEPSTVCIIEKQH